MTADGSFEPLSLSQDGDGVSSAYGVVEMVGGDFSVSVVADPLEGALFSVSLQGGHEYVDLTPDQAEAVAHLLLRAASARRQLDPAA